MSEGFIGLFLFALASLPLALFDLAFLPGLGCAITLAALIAGITLYFHLRAEPKTVTIVPQARLDTFTGVACSVLAVVLCLIGGEMHFFSPTSDWVVRDGVLHDLVVSPWPVHYEIDGRDFLLRAPLGLYLVPAAIGKIFGLAAAHVALFVQDAAILAALLIIFTARCRSWRARLVTLGVFIFFSGLDSLPWVKSWLFGQSAPFDWHLESWVPYLQYSSHITQLFWVPHHALAGWGFIAAYLSWRRESLPAWSLVAVFALCTLWSPLAMIGALPFLCFALLNDLRMRGFKWREALGPLLIAAGSLPAIAYLMIDSGTVEKRWLFLDPDFPVHYVEFLIVELVLWFWIFYATPHQEDEPFYTSDLWIAGISLLLFPLYSISFSNDFTMRASIPALALVALAAAPRVGRMLQVPGARRGALVLGLVIAAATPGVEIARAILMPTRPLGGCSLPRAWQAWENEEVHDRLPMTAYIARPEASPISHFLNQPSAAISAAAPCDPPIFAFPFMNREVRSAKLAISQGDLQHTDLQHADAPHGNLP